MEDGWSHQQLMIRKLDNHMQKSIKMDLYSHNMQKLIQNELKT